MLTLVRMHDYPEYEKCVAELNDFLSSKEEKTEFEESAVRLFVRAKNVIGAKLETVEDSEQYLKWCKQVEAMQLRILGQQYSHASRKEDLQLHLHIDKCYKELEYLLSSKCIQLYTDD